MNCFVIMPFSPEFDDVYAVIKSTVEDVASTGGGRCFRLDESRPAGRITDRLLNELRSATLCVADLTSTKPNVMWETGFAMALAKPTILLTQDLASLPFDIKDMQSIPYDRSRLSATLAGPLRRSILDTLGSIKPTSSIKTEGPSPESFGALMSEVAQLKQMVAEAVGAWKGSKALLSSRNAAEVQQLVGNWLNQESGSHLYSRVVGGELITAYCYGDNNHLTGIYYDWRRVGNYWFAKYKWIGSDLSGFTFLKQESLDVLSGAWWDASEEQSPSPVLPKNAGVPSSWLRQPEAKPPKWAQQLFDSVERDGLAKLLASAG